MKITNKTVGWGIIVVLMLGLLYPMSMLLELGFMDTPEPFDFMAVVGFILWAIALCVLIANLITGGIDFEFEIKNPFKRGTYLTPEQEKEFKEFLKERDTWKS